MRNQPPADAGFVFRLRITEAAGKGDPRSRNASLDLDKDVEILVSPQRRPASADFFRTDYDDNSWARCPFRDWPGTELTATAIRNISASAAWREQFENDAHVPR